MILVDTSVWIDHLRKGMPMLAAILQDAKALIHPFVLGELACGNLDNRQELLRLLSDLPGAPVASDAEALHFIETHHLMGRGIGYIDIHLLASTKLFGSAQLWTRDKRLSDAATDLGLEFRCSSC